MRLKYWWWIVRYRGKKNIPREIVFGALSKSMVRMNENLMAAFREMPEDMSAEDKKLLFESLQKGKAIEGEIQRLKDNDSV